MVRCRPVDGESGRDCKPLAAGLPTFDRPQTDEARQKNGTQMTIDDTVECIESELTFTEQEKTELMALINSSHEVHVES